jgi:hypothetical protein
MTTTTQELGVPVTQDEMDKLLILKDLNVLELEDWLNPLDYPTNQKEARQAFKQRFAFYNILNLNPTSEDNLSLVKVSVLWRDFMDWCACPPAVLLDRRRYDSDLEVAQCELQERIVSYDLFKSPTLVYGPPRGGKSGWVSVHAYHGKKWFDLPVTCYRFRLNEDAFGEYSYLDERSLLDEAQKVTRIVEQKGKPYLEWTRGKTDKEKQEAKLESAEKLKILGAMVIYEEAHKIVAKDHRTLLSMYIKDQVQEWGHHSCQPIFITHNPGLLDRERIIPFINIEMGVSRNYSETDTTDVQIIQKETKDTKPSVTFCRRDYYPLWTHNAPIASRSLTTAHDIKKWARAKANEIMEEEDGHHRPTRRQEQAGEEPGGADTAWEGED